MGGLGDAGAASCDVNVNVWRGLERSLRRRCTSEESLVQTTHSLYHSVRVSALVLSWLRGIESTVTNQEVRYTRRFLTTLFSVPNTDVACADVVFLIRATASISGSYAKGAHRCISVIRNAARRFVLATGDER